MHIACTPLSADRYCLPLKYDPATGGYNVSNSHPTMPTYLPPNLRKYAAQILSPTARPSPSLPTCAASKGKGNGSRKSSRELRHLGKAENHTIV